MEPRIVYDYSGEELFAMGTHVIVERWRQLQTGSGLRKFQTTFSDEEQKTIREKILPVVKGWYYRGMPTKRWRFESLQDVNLLQRAAQFFAEV